MAVQLGQKVKDSITGFSGVATARTEFLYGCVRILIEPGKMKDGVPVEAQWFDEQRVDAKSALKTGGPGPVPPSRDYRR